MAGKGSKPRPSSVDQITFDQNWDRIFGSFMPLGIVKLGMGLKN